MTLFGNNKKKMLDERKKQKLKKYNFTQSPFDSGEDFLKYIAEYESVCRTEYDTDEEEHAALLKLIAKQNLMILAELRNITSTLHDDE